MRVYFFRSLILVAAIFASVSFAAAQEGKPSDTASSADTPRPAVKPQADRPAQLLHHLGLTQEQVHEIKRLHMEQRPAMDQAQTRLREASRALNEAIYADQVNEADIQTRLSELQQARNDVEKARYMTELSVRRVLTQEQLVRFREMRERFEQMRKTREMRRTDRIHDRQRPGAPSKRSLDGRTPSQPMKHADKKAPII